MNDGSKNSDRAVVIVDDDEDLREALGDALAAHGYAVYRAADGQEALDLLRRIPRPLAILTDLTMPGMNGYTFLDRLASDPALRDIPRLAVAGHRSTPIYGVPVLTKPFELDELLHALAVHETSPEWPEPD